MFVIEKRLNMSYAIQIEEADTCLLRDMHLWLSPFFTIQEVLSNNSVVIITKFILCDKCNYDMECIDDIFLINSKLPRYILYEKILFLSRVLFKNIAIKYGYQNLHAGCFVHNNQGILITAERNQGKTTLLLNSMLEGNYTFLANDQVMYNSVNGQILGYPSIIGIRNNSIIDMKKWDEIKSKAVTYVKDPFQSNDKPLILINDLCSLLHCNIVEKCKLSLIIRYKKSENSDDLIISEAVSDRSTTNSFILPLEQTYSHKIYTQCFLLVKKKTNPIQVPLNMSSKSTIKFIDVCCGINRMRDLLEAIKAFLK